MNLTIEGKDSENKPLILLVMDLEKSKLHLINGTSYQTISSTDISS